MLQEFVLLPPKMKEPIIVSPESFAVIFQCTYILPIQRDLLLNEMFSFLNVGEKKKKSENESVYTS